MIVQQPPLGTPINKSHPLAKGLVGCWLLNEGGGNSLVDYVSINNGVNNGATWVGSAKGKTMNFSAASSQYVEVGNKSALKIVQNITLSAWVNINNMPTSGVLSYFIGKGYDNVNEAYFLRLYNQGGTIKLQSGSYQLSGNQNYLASWNISGWGDSEWHHVVGVYDGTNWKVYFNGVEKGKSPFATGAINTDLPVLLGAMRNGGITERYLDGKLTNAMIWNRALTETEVRQLYTNPYAMFQQRQSFSFLEQQEILNRYKFNNSGVRPRMFAPCIAR